MAVCVSWLLSKVEVNHISDPSHLYPSISGVWNRQPAGKIWPSEPCHSGSVLSLGLIYTHGGSWCRASPWAWPRDHPPKLAPLAYLIWQRLQPVWDLHCLCSVWKCSWSDSPVAHIGCPGQSVPDVAPALGGTLCTAGLASVLHMVLPDTLCSMSPRWARAGAMYSAVRGLLEQRVVSALATWVPQHWSQTIWSGCWISYVGVRGGRGLKAWSSPWTGLLLLIWHTCSIACQSVSFVKLA